MKNFAEEIAYLYFRLNGFFLLDNYVSHKAETSGGNHSDSDLIGIKPKGVNELVGLKNDIDFDENLLLIIGDSKWVGLICEVKGGLNNNWTLNSNKIKACVKRLGLIEESEIKNAIKELEKSSCYYNNMNNVRIIKVLATDKPRKKNEKKWNVISLSEMIVFIKRRVSDYPIKGNAWHHNNSSLFQYLMYEKRK